MLVLSRKTGERLVIGNNIVVTVVKVGSNKVQLAIDAPPEVPIHREEIAQRLQAEAAADSRHVLADCI